MVELAITCLTLAEQLKAQIFQSLSRHHQDTPRHLTKLFTLDRLVCNTIFPLAHRTTDHYQNTALYIGHTRLPVV
jgi:hypothetical protein